MPKTKEIPLKKLTIRLEEPIYAILRDYAPVPYSVLLRYLAKKYVKSLLNSNPKITQSEELVATLEEPFDDGNQ